MKAEILCYVQLETGIKATNVDSYMLRTKAQPFWYATKETFAAFFADRPFQLAAALSYYTLLSLAPILLVVIGIAGLAFGEAAVRGQLVEQIRSLVGQQSAEAIQTMIAHASRTHGGFIPTIVGIVIMLIGATTVFMQLQAALNQIWHVEAAPDHSAILGFIRNRLLSLAVVISLGFFMLVSLVLSATISGLHGYLTTFFPGAAILVRVLNIVVTLVMITVVIALIFKFLPDVEIAWRDVWVGAVITSALFAVGKYVIGLYLGHAGVGSGFGAAGSIVVLMVWVYYTSLILFFGAEITQVYARRIGTTIRPGMNARSTDAAE